MKPFGFGIMKDMFMFFRGYTIKIKNNIDADIEANKKTASTVAETELAGTPAEAAIVTDKDEAGNNVFKDNVVLIRWPLRAQIFVDMRPDNAGQLQLQRKNGLYNGNDNTEPSHDDIRGLDVMQIPELIHVPILSPVMQDERIMNIDILTERGIFIGLSQIDASLYYEAVGHEYTETADIMPPKQAASPESIPFGTTGIGGVQAMPFEPIIKSPVPNPDGNTVASMDDIKDIVWGNHKLGSDIEIPEPETSDLYAPISPQSKTVKKSIT